MKKRPSTVEDSFMRCWRVTTSATAQEKTATSAASQSGLSGKRVLNAK